MNRPASRLPPPPKLSLDEGWNTLLDEGWGRGGSAMTGTRHARSPRQPPQGREYVLGTLLAALVAGLVLATQGYWRRGMILIGGALLAGAALRLFLPVRRVGLLAVRSRAFDVVMLAALGAGVILATALVPVPGA